jgi:hypothetical protein
MSENMSPNVDTQFKLLMAIHAMETAQAISHIQEALATTSVPAPQRAAIGRLTKQIFHTTDQINALINKEYIDG